MAVKSLLALLLSLSLFLVSVSPLSAQSNSGVPSWNIPVKTFGGMQLWTDNYLHASWRIQRNIVTGHSRLLDPENIRRAWGNYEHCKAVFNDLRKRNNIVPASGHLVLLVHGIAPRPGTFSAMQATLQAQGYDATSISYPSTRETIEVHAAGLEALINRLEGTEKISFVTHSMGGLVVRSLLNRQGAWRKQIEIDSIVQIAPPHLGATAAEWIADLKPYQWVLGQSGQQLTPDAASRLPLLKVPFGIIAGGKADGDGFNPLLPGDDDGVVRVAETKLPGARDFLLVDDMHTALVSNPQTIQATINFLQRGAFANKSEAE